MNGISHRLGQLIGGVVLVISGLYLMVYLYRWEWNRAVVAGVFFVATEVALSTTAILRRLRALETRLDQQTLQRVREAAPPPKDHFAWLDRQSRTLNVFVPVLLGAGVILSVLAAAVERLATATATPFAEHRLSRRLNQLALPAGGLLAPLPPAPATRPHTFYRLASRGFVVVAAVFVGVVAVNTIADNTQDRPDPPTRGTTDVTMEVFRRNTGRSVAGTAEALVVACRHTIGHNYDLKALTARGSVVEFTVSPVVGRHATRRFVGCLEDAQFPRVSAAVRDVRSYPE